MVQQVAPSVCGSMPLTVPLVDLSHHLPKATQELLSIATTVTSGLHIFTNILEKYNKSNCLVCNKCLIIQECSKSIRGFNNVYIYFLINQ